MTPDDLPRIEAWLDAEDDIAQIVSIGENKWQARRVVELTIGGRWCLFHTACGPLPLLASRDSEEPDEDIADPFAGWTERRPGAVPGTPYFGSGHVAIFRLNVGPVHDDVSYFTVQWIGDRYSILGRKAPDAAKKWWARMRRFVLKDAVKVDSQMGPPKPRSPYWATPRALVASASRGQLSI